MKTIKIIRHGNREARVIKDSEYQEYKVELYSNHYLNGEVHHENATYHTDCKYDAISTAQVMVKANITHKAAA